MSTTVPETPSRSPARSWYFWPLITLWLACAGVGGWAIVQRFTAGKELANYNSYVPWGLWVAMYIYLMGLSAGCYLLSTLVFVFRVERLRPLGKPALWAAFVTMVTALGMISLDLGHPFRAWHVYASPNFRSVMAWMIWLYSAYFIFLVVVLRLAIRAPNSKTLQVLSALGIPLVISFNGGVGALFGVIGAQPGWNSGLYPLLFIVGGLTSGGALLLFLSVILFPDCRKPDSPLLGLLRPLVLCLVAVDALFVWSELSVGTYASVPGHAKVYRQILFGPYWYNFWLLQIGAAAVLPLALLILGKRRPVLLALAGLLVVVGFVGVRLNIVIPELTLPHLAGFEEAYRDQRLRFQYFPSFNEWAVTAGFLAFGVLLFVLGWRKLPLTPETGTGVEDRSAAVDETVSRRRLWLAAAGGAVAGILGGWGFFRTTRRPQFASGGKHDHPILELPVIPAPTREEEVLVRMQIELDRAMKKPVEERRWGMVIDTRKCVGCHACTIACVAENHLPPGVVYRPVLTEEIGTFPNLAMRFMPRPCMQCDDPPCVPVCPVKATYSRPDGIVEINYDDCIGCRYCLTACPYNARTSDFGDFHTSNTPEVQPYEQAPSFEYGKEWNRAGHGSPIGNARKCHFCLHRLERGMLPECVTTCIGRATLFGDLNDPESLVSQENAKANRMVLLEHLGTRPKVTYLT